MSGLELFVLAPLAYGVMHLGNKVMEQRDLINAHMETISTQQKALESAAAAAAEAAASSTSTPGAGGGIDGVRGGVGGTLGRAVVFGSVAFSAAIASYNAVQLMRLNERIATARRRDTSRAERRANSARRRDPVVSTAAAGAGAEQENETPVAGGVGEASPASAPTPPTTTATTSSDHHNTATSSTVDGSTNTTPTTTATSSSGSLPAPSLSPPHVVGNSSSRNRQTTSAPREADYDQREEAAVMQAEGTVRQTRPSRQATTESMFSNDEDFVPIPLPHAGRHTATTSTTAPSSSTGLFASTMSVFSSGWGLWGNASSANAAAANRTNPQQLQNSLNRNNIGLSRREDGSVVVATGANPVATSTNEARVIQVNGHLHHCPSSTYRPQIAASEADACRICFDNQRDTLLMPCRHLVACWPCAVEIYNQSSVSSTAGVSPRSMCPVCRVPIDSLQFSFIV